MNDHTRKPKAAPSDTDLEAAIEAVAQVMFEPPSLGQDDPEYTWAQMVLEDPSRADMYRQDAAAALEAAARTSQPVQVEVTDNTFSRMMSNLDRLGRETIVALIAELNEVDADIRGELGTDVASRAAAALSAALGGDE